MGNRTGGIYWRDLGVSEIVRVRDPLGSPVLIYCLSPNDLLVLGRDVHYPESHREFAGSSSEGPPRRRLDLDWPRGLLSHPADGLFEGPPYALDPQRGAARLKQEGAGDGFLRSRRPHHRSSHTTPTPAPTHSPTRHPHPTPGEEFYNKTPRTTLGTGLARTGTEKNLNKTTLSHSRQARHRCELARASTITGTPPEYSRALGALGVQSVTSHPGPVS